MLSRSQMALAVGRADVATMTGFSSAAGYFHTGRVNRNYWKYVATLPTVTNAFTLPEHSFVIVDGDVLADVAAADGATLIIYGNLQSSIKTTGMCDILIAGDLLDTASISGDGILDVFIGGNVSGQLGSSGSLAAWVEGHFGGSVWTGHPSTELRVRGDCTATIRPIDKASLLYLEIDGFVPYELLQAAAAFGYTEFNASIGRSDRPPGYYPDETAVQHRSYNRWVIHECMDAQ